MASGANATSSASIHRKRSVTSLTYGEILATGQPHGHSRLMFSIDEPTADAIRRALSENGELAAIIELRRHFPLIGDNAQARMCVRAIASWGPVAALKDVQARMKPRRPR